MKWYLEDQDMKMRIGEVQNLGGKCQSYEYMIGIFEQLIAAHEKFLDKYLEKGVEKSLQKKYWYAFKEKKMSRKKGSKTSLVDSQKMQDGPK